MNPQQTTGNDGQKSIVVLGLGANLGDRLATLRTAATALDQLDGVRVTARSSVYETPPAGGPAQPDYLNAAVAVETSLTPGELLERLLVIEHRLGRRRPDAVRWGPRTIDIDLLWMNRATFGSPDLEVPHPRLTERAFALVPLLELVPNAAHPISGLRYDSLPAARQTLERVAQL